MRVHAVWFGDVDSVSGAHGAHARSSVGEPGRTTNVPGGQVVHTAHESALKVVLKCPAGHAEQVWDWELEDALDA